MDFSTLVEITPLSITLRLVLSALFGGILGLERGLKKRPAGFRTYMVVCIGATLTMLTNQYVYETFHTSDPVRLGAQVISGIGFLGAGTIMVTGRNQVKGLTTAAGLWAAACVGLALGIGFYMGAIITALFIFFSVTVMHNIDGFLTASSKVMVLYIEFDSISNISHFLNDIQDEEMKVTHVDLKKPKFSTSDNVSGIFTIRCYKKMDHQVAISCIQLYHGILYVEEL